MMKNLKGKNAVVTGAAKGIGRGIAERFAQEGVNVLVADILGEEAKAAAAELTKTYSIHAEGYAIDLRNNDEIEAMMDFANRAFGSIDILVCNAGITIHNWATDYPIEDIDKVFDLDIRGYYLCARTAARYMKKQGVENGTIKMDKNFQVIPDKRFIEVEEIASVVAFLASDEASAINGQNILADLGWSKNALPENTDME